MVGTARTAAARSAMLGYIPPEGASEANAARARAVCGFRRLRLRPEEKFQETLQELAAKYDSKPPRRWKAHNVLHNDEFLVAMILTGEGRHDAIPPEWQQPSDQFRENRKRSRASAFAQAAVPVQLVVSEFNVMDPDRYFSIAHLLHEMTLQAGSDPVVCLCSLPSSFKKSTALVRKACFDIRLWKGYATSTPAEQQEHLQKWSRRFQKMLSGEPNSSITAAFSDYEVGLNYTVVFKQRSAVQITSVDRLPRHCTEIATQVLSNSIV